MFATAVRIKRDLGIPSVSLNALAGHRSCPGGLRRAAVHHAAGAAPVTGVFSGRRLLAPSGDWDSGNPAFAISRGSPGAPPLTPGHGRRFSGMLFSLASFRTPVSHQIQRYLLSSLPAARAIQQCASWRTRSVKPSAQPTLVRTQHLPHKRKQPTSCEFSARRAVLLCPTVCHRVALWTGVLRGPRTYSGRRRAARTVGVTAGFPRTATDGSHRSVAVRGRP